MFHKDSDQALIERCKGPFFHTFTASRFVIEGKHRKPTNIVFQDNVFTASVFEKIDKLGRFYLESFE